MSLYHMSTHPGPLSGRLILDCSILLPGPFAGKLLAQQGARVLKIESPLKPDPARSMGSGALYDDTNSLKERVPLDLTDSADRPAFESLVLQADALIEGFRPKTKELLGLDPARLHRINPRLLIVSLVGFPEDGPDRDRPAHDLNFQALSGTLSLLEGLPGLPLADLLAGYEAAFRLAAALDQQARTQAPGQRIVVTLMETLRHAQSKHTAEYLRTGLVPEPGNTLITGQHPCYRIYKSRDGKKIAVGAIEAKFWAQTCQVLGRPDLAELGMSCGSEAQRVIHEVAQAFASKDWSEWAPAFEKLRCCVDPVLDYSQVFGPAGKE